MKIVSVGHNNAVDFDKVIAISIPCSNAIKRLTSLARENNKLIDLTAGRAAKSVLTMQDGWIILSSLAPATIVLRANRDDGQRPG